MNDWLLNDEVITVLSTTYAEPGLREEQNAAEKARLAEVKAGMSAEELIQIMSRDESPWTIFEQQLQAAGYTMDDFYRAYSAVIPVSGNQALIEMLDQGERIEGVIESGVVPEELFRQVLQEMFRTGGAADGSTDADMAEADQATAEQTNSEPSDAEQAAVEPSKAEQAAARDHAAAALLENSSEALRGIVEAAGDPVDTAAMVSELQAVDIQTLPEEVHEYTVYDETAADGVRNLMAEAEVDDIGEVLIMLDASGLPQEDLHWFALMLPMLSQLDTEQHSQAAISALLARYTYGSNASYALPVQYDTKEYNPYLNTGFIALGEDLETAFDLVYEVLFETVFTDTDAVSGLIDRALSSARSGISYGAYYLMITRHLGATEPAYAYSSYLSGLDYYAFLNEVSQMMQEDPEAVTTKLREVQQSMKNRCNAITVFAGDPELFDAAAEQRDAFLQKLNNDPITPAVYEFEAPAKREALIIDSTVQYNGLIASYETIGLEGYTADLDAVKSLVADTYLIPQLRVQYGVYTPMHEYTDYGAYLLSYSDPNITETFDVYAGLGEYLKDFDVDQDTLDGYIMSAYSALAAMDGELFGAISAANRRICGIPDDLRVQQMEQLKSLTPEKLRSYAAAYEALAERGDLFTVGGSAAIHEHEDLYDLILDPLKDFG